MIDKENLEFAEGLLKTSKSHLTSSKILYNEKQYADAIMLLQQSAENAIKAYFVIMGFEPEDLNDLKKFQHTPIDEDVLTSILMLFFGRTFQNLIVECYKIPIVKDYIISQTLKDAKTYYEIIKRFTTLEYSFELDIKYKPYLKNGGVNPQVRNYFIKEGHNLPLNSKVLEIDRNSWKITDGDNKYNKYKIKDIGTQLKVYSLNDLGILEMEKEEILYYVLKFPFDKYSVDYTSENLQNQGDSYKEDLKKAKEKAKDEKIKTEIDNCFLKAYGVNSEEYFEECYNKIHNKIDIKNIDKTHEQKYIEMVNNFCEKMMENIKWSMKIRSAKPVTLIYIALITGPHLLDGTRYAKTSNEIRLNRSDYKKGLGIVDAYPKIRERLEKCIGFIEFIKNKKE